MQDSELQYLRRCIELAEQALDAGDAPFGSVLVDAQGTALAEARNRIGGGDHTQHPEFELVRWAAQHMTPEQRATATVYTSGEHCPMCSAAHGWVGLGRIVYISSARQLLEWHQDMGLAPPPVNMLPIQDIAPNVRVEGPVDMLVGEVEALHRRRHGGRGRVVERLLDDA
ncbi:nucleoside deaminase [Halopseudomonas pachastrellae]|nr:nucleoside deaminase [Halopseudomonas pachastrellae]|tara:strand:+ start:2649 stop:3158 length:510 start_codon:yes stop_codon:yes gene_type:complete